MLIRLASIPTQNQLHCLPCVLTVAGVPLVPLVYRFVGQIDSIVPQSRGCMSAKGTAVLRTRPTITP